MDPIELAPLDLANALVELFSISRGLLHGVYQGSHEAAIFEAQGGQIGPGGFNHLGSVLSTASAIQSKLDAVNLPLNRLSGISAALGGRLRAICEPILALSRAYLDTANQTSQAATALQQSDPIRFEGVILGQGGMGPEVGRTIQSLPSSQINAIAAQLEQRGIEPRLVPAARAALQPTLNAIRQLPIDGKESAAKLSVALGNMRLLIRQTVVRAGLVGRARVIAAFLSVEAALVAFGSRLTSPIVIPQSILHGIMGIPEA